MAKVSRDDELQADRYGLQLMSRAGYDPESMVTMMAHLAVLQNEHSDAVTKYLEDHPDPQARVAHLMGYPELDPTIVTPAQKLVQASSDEERARYDFASAASRIRCSSGDPRSSEALLDLGRGRAGARDYRTRASRRWRRRRRTVRRQRAPPLTHRISALRQMEAQHVTLTKPNLPKLQAAIVAAQTAQAQDATEIAARAAQGKDQVKAVQSRSKRCSTRFPTSAASTSSAARASKRSSRISNSMSRSINSALQDAGGDSGPLGGVGSLEKNKESGLLKDSADIYHEMLAPFAMAPIPTQSLAILPSYPQMTSELTIADSEMLRAVDAARASLTMLDQSLGDLDEFLKQLDHEQLSFNGDITQSEYDQISQAMTKTVDDFNNAATAASQSAQLFNLARSRQLSVRITLLGVGTSPAIYSTLRYALQQRFGSAGVDYRTMLRGGLTPGDVTAATIIAADIKSTPESVIAEAKSSGKTIIDVANAHKMHAWPLEIFMGLVYLDYTDDPSKELRKADGTLAVDLNKLGL